MNILFTTRIPKEGLTALSMHTLVMPTDSMFTTAELMERLPACDILVPTYDRKITAAMLMAAPRLRLIANFGVGFNNIDIEAARQRGIMVTNTVQPVIEPTAEQTFTLMLAVAHRTAELDRKMRQTNDIKIGVMNNLGVSIYGKTLGIIGMGRIGQAVARRAAACGMHVIYHNRHRLDYAREHACSATYYADKEALLAMADFVIPMVPYTPETHHLIDSAAFDLMKPGAILVNTSRGAVIDEAALIRALQAGKLWGAGLDVYEFEPKISPELLQMDNVVMSPHIGTGTIDGRIAMCRRVAENIIHIFEGNPDVDWVVKKSM